MRALVCPNPRNVVLAKIQMPRNFIARHPAYAEILRNCSNQARSMHMATPMPPPMHRVARPFFASRRAIS